MGSPTQAIARAVSLTVYQAVPTRHTVSFLLVYIKTVLCDTFAM